MRCSLRNNNNITVSPDERNYQFMCLIYKYIFWVFIWSCRKNICRKKLLLSDSSYCYYKKYFFPISGLLRRGVLRYVSLYIKGNRELLTYKKLAFIGWLRPTEQKKEAAKFYKYVTFLFYICLK